MGFLPKKTNDYLSFLIFPMPICEHLGIFFYNMSLKENVMIFYIGAKWFNPLMCYIYIYISPKLILYVQVFNLEILKNVEEQ
jgi:hypothetical protein